MPTSSVRPQNVAVTTMLLIYNERGNIISLSEKVLAVYDENDIDGELLLVDDGSTDGSGKICARLARDHGRIRTVCHEKNKGRSHAILTGFRSARGRITILMDGDRQYDPREIPRFLDKMEEGWDIVSGRRMERRDGWIRRFISRIYNRWIIRRRLGLDVADQNSGFKAFSTKKALAMGFDPEGFLGLHRFILPLAAVKGLSITEVPVSHFDRQRGRSYIRFYTVPFITYRDFMKFKKKYKAELKAYKKKKSEKKK